ncbi:MAG TPA: tetratricopeptide repeat protein, partial [Clostridia bacterium]|nr:tetratricopeptide repeat protein [Clostridia bacterium]
LTCDKALEIDRENYKALSLKGLILAFDVSPEQGIGQVLKALKINPGYTQAFYDMAMAQKLAKHYDESISYFQKVLAVDPQNTWSLYGIATNYADKRDKANALSYLEKAMALDPEHVRPEALSQDHFEWLRGDADFQKVVGGK